MVGVGFDPTGGGVACMSSQGWLLSAANGLLFHASLPSNWEGQPQGETKLKEGDVVVRLPFPPLTAAPSRACLTPLCVAQGLLLDCDAATLTVWVNGERKGVMVRPGMTDEDGEPVGRLEGALRWAVDLQGECSIAIAGPLPPPRV